MVIGFSVDEARNHLLEQGEVYTYRWNRRAFFRDERGDIEHTWANSGRGTKKITDVTVREIGQIEPIEENLEKYAELSGFWSVGSWCLEIAEMGLKANRTGWLYKVCKEAE